jgi:ribosomal 50S subunit-associated protein YjgA (DUF615 family)
MAVKKRTKREEPERLPRGSVVRTVLLALDGPTDAAVTVLVKRWPDVSQAEVLRRVIREAAETKGKAKKAAPLQGGAL